MGLLIPLAAILCVAVWWSVRRIAGEGTEIFANRDMDKLLLETGAVAADFLEAGELVQLLSREKYQGTISVRLQSRGRCRVGCMVCMYDSGDIAQTFREFQRDFPEEDFPELGHFVKTYGGCYDARRDALVYMTACDAKLSKDGRAALEGELYQRIALHPLAQMESLSQIRTKNLHT